MKNIDIIRAWKNEEYRLSLTESQRAQLPQNPAGMVELKEADLELVVGGDKPVFSEHGSGCATSDRCITGRVTCPFNPTGNYTCRIKK